jgi:inner membrane protein
MNYKSHRVAGLCTGLVVGTLMIKTPYTAKDIGDIAMITAAAGFGSLIPDIDEPNSYAGSHIRPISAIIKATAGHRGAFHSPFMGLTITGLLLACYVFGGTDFATMANAYWTFSIALVCCVILACLIAFGKHNGFPLINFVWGITSLIYLFEFKDAGNFFLINLYGFMIGYFSHLLMDMLTVGGIPLLWPLTEKKFRIAHLRTNENEALAQLLFILPTIAILYYTMAPYSTQLVNAIKELAGRIKL